MEIRKICRFLILIFIVLSLLFYYLYTVELEKRTVVSDEFVADAVKNLSSYGITINDEDIEKSMPERDIYWFEIGDDSDYYKRIISSISKNVFDSDIVTTEFDTPEGYSVGLYDKNSYERELGRITFSDSDLLFVFSKNGVGIKDGDQPIENMQVDKIDGRIIELIDNVVSKLTDSSKLGYRITGSSSNDTYLIVTVMLTIDNSDISNSFINFVFQNSEIVIMSGNWITGQPKAKYHNTLLDGVNVLYKLNLEQVNTIESQQVVYTLRSSGEKEHFIIPCWKIKYTDKQGNLVVSYFDAL